ncbi:hypothetical protein RRG08_047420 [Elysia crispata]|uniref:Uncharacterized protein n=1 Tax=Elysia crispata TaxID=231223 RepID=A0AAE1D4N6_9GAST|nr:hypothetical protein RRG08_047420 [Elysia crispata]
MSSFDQPRLVTHPAIKAEVRGSEDYEHKSRANWRRTSVADLLVIPRQSPRLLYRRLWEDGTPFNTGTDKARRNQRASTLRKVSQYWENYHHTIIGTHTIITTTPISTPTPSLSPHHYRHPHHHYHHTIIDTHTIIIATPLSTPTPSLSPHQYRHPHHHYHHTNIDTHTIIIATPLSTPTPSLPPHHYRHPHHHYHHTTAASASRGSLTLLKHLLATTKRQPVRMLFWAQLRFPEISWKQLVSN